MDLTKIAVGVVEKVKHPSSKYCGEPLGSMWGPEETPLVVTVGQWVGAQR